MSDEHTFEQALHETVVEMDRNSSPWTEVFQPETAAPSAPAHSESDHAGQRDERAADAEALPTHDALASIFES